jgi:AraC-like DNA-binding protein
MENIIVISRDKGTVALVKKVLGRGDTIVLNSESFEGLIESIKVNQHRLIIIDSTLKYDERYFAFIKFIQEFNMIPFLLLSTSTDTKCLHDIRYVAPDGFLIVPFNDLELKICIAVIQAKFDKNQKNRVEMGQNDDVPLAIRKTLNYIDFNIFKKIEVTDLANITKWEKNYFIKIFLNYVGITPYQYILEKKVEKAKLLIIQTDYPINQISYELGFKSYTNFVSAFKKIANSSPSQFKKLNYSNVAVDTNDMFGD